METHHLGLALRLAEIPDALLRRAASLSSATLHEAAGRLGALPSQIKPLDSQMRLCGRAFPVKSPPGDNLWLHRAIYEADTGDVLVVETSGADEYGYWGEVMAVAAQVRGLAGLVITGGVRDSLRMIDMGFPVFSSKVCIVGTGKDPSGAGALGEPVLIGNIHVCRGDLVFADADGVVVLAAAVAAEAISLSEKRDRAEQHIFERLRAGETTVGIYGLAGDKVRKG